MMSTSTWLRDRSRPARRNLALTVALGELSGILLILQTSFLVQIGNGVMFRGSSLPRLLPVFAALLGVILLRALAAWGSRRAAFECASGAKLTLRRELTEHLQAIGPIALAGMRAGEIAHTTVDAVEALDAYFSKYLPQRAIATLLPFTILAVVFPLDWISGLVLVLTAVFLPLNMIVIGEESHARNQRLWGKLARMSGHFLDALQGLATTKMFGAARREAGEIARTSEEYRGMTMSVLKVAFLSSFMLELIASVSIALVAILSGLRLLSASMEFAPGYFILLIAPEYFLTLRALGTFYHSRMEAVSAADQVRALLQTGSPRRLPDSPPATRAVARPAARIAPRPRHARGVAFEGVSFAYEARPILEDVTFSVSSGEHVAVLGASGAGKSTLLSLLLGFATPDSGRLLIDGNDLRDLDSRAWLDTVAWLPQRPTLFHGTLRDNIVLGRPSAGDREIREAIRLSHASEFIERMPAGLHTRVGEGGQGLSMGQLQRVALARLFLRDPGLVLLDEPTAHLDPESERMVNAGIRNLTEGRTTVLVTHRPADGVDRVLALAAGRIREAS
ncbi:MAG: thiol reductant ABC exporter subunit CydD [Spirochaetia bacterium]